MLSKDVGRRLRPSKVISLNLLDLRMVPRPRRRRGKSHGSNELFSMIDGGRSMRYHDAGTLVIRWKAQMSISMSIGSQLCAMALPRSMTSEIQT